MNVIRPIKSTWLAVVVVALAVLLAGFGVAAGQEATPPAAPEATAEADSPAEATGDRAFLGVTIADGEDGVEVTAVSPDSPAQAAGLQAGDIITQFNGREVPDAEALVSAVSEQTPGDVVTLTYVRDGETDTVEITLGRRAPDDDGARAFAAPLAFTLQGDGYTLEGSTRVVWTLSEVEDDSPLYEAGFRSGDVLISLNAEPFDVAVLAAALADADAAALLTFVVEREGERITVSPSAEQLREAGIDRPLPGFQRGDLPMLPDVQPFFDERGLRGMFSMMNNGFLGVGFETLDERIADEHDLGVTEGAWVQEVVEGSPAEQAGLQVGDIITAVNGEPVDRQRTLRERLYAYEPGETVTLTVLREGETLELSATLDEPQVLPMLLPFDLEELLPDMLPETSPELPPAGSA